MIGRRDTIDGLNWLASRLEAMDETELATVRAAMAVGSYYRLQDVIALTYNTEFYVLLQNVHNEADFGRYYLHDSGIVEMPEEWKAGMDPARFRAHIMEQEKGRRRLSVGTQRESMAKAADRQRLSRRRFHQGYCTHHRGAAHRATTQGPEGKALYPGTAGRHYEAKHRILSRAISA